MIAGQRAAAGAAPAPLAPLPPYLAAVNPDTLIPGRHRLNACVPRLRAPGGDRSHHHEIAGQAPEPA
jgi:hypothetical protein